LQEVVQRNYYIYFAFFYLQIKLNLYLSIFCKTKKRQWEKKKNIYYSCEKIVFLLNLLIVYFLKKILLIKILLRKKTQHSKRLHIKKSN
jgi:hypothetical protein